MRLTESEWKIANCLWKKAPMTIAEITEELSATTGWTRFTVITLLKRMTEKGAVSFVQEGRTKKFSPSIDKKDAENEEVTSLLDKVYDGNAGLLISSLIIFPPNPGPHSLSAVPWLPPLLRTPPVLPRRPHCNSGMSLHRSYSHCRRWSLSPLE